MNKYVVRSCPAQRFICVILAAAMAVGPSMNVLAQQPAPPPKREAPQPSAPARAKAPSGAIDTTYVAPMAAAVIVFHPAQLMKSPMAELLPVEVASAAGLKYLGFDPANVEEATGFVDLSNPQAPNYGLTFKFSQPIRGSDIPQQLRAHTQPDQLMGKSYLKSQQPMMPSFYAPNNRTLLVAPDAAVKQFVEFPDPSKSGPIIDRVRKVPSGSDLYVAIDVASLRPLIQMGLAQAQSQIPPDARPLLEAVNLLSAAELTVNLSSPGPTSLVAHANDEAAAQKLEKIMADATAKYQAQMKAQFAAEAASSDPVERAFAQYMERVSGRWSQPLMPKREGAQLTFFRVETSNSPQQQLVVVAVIGVLVALLLPAVQAAREAARRNQSMNNLKQLVLGLLNFESAKRSLPANAIYSADGKPLLSWRVQILPYLEEGALYNEFHLDEPWDSEHNRPLIARMPQVFKNPNLPMKPGKTNYLAVVGKECIFDGTKKGVGFRQITDGTSKTILLLEANADQAVEWTKPADWDYNANNPKAGLGGIRPGGWNAAFCDGHIQFISNETDAQILKALFTRAGGEVIGNF
jgi:type II secretory pathway pseudopilin PulG